MTATENSGNECSESVRLPVPSASVPPIVEIAVVPLLAVVPDLYSSFLSYLQPFAVSFSATHIWLIVRALQVSAPVLLLIHLTGGNWEKHGLRHRLRPVDAAIAVALVGSGYLAAEGVLYAMIDLGVDVASDQFNPILDEQLPQSSLILFLTIAASGIANGFAEELVNPRNPLVHEATMVQNSPWGIDE